MNVWFYNNITLLQNVICLYLDLLCTQGMVDPGDTVSRTLRKEFGEEAMNSLEASPKEKRKIEKQINELFKEGYRVSKRETRREGGGIEGERE